MIPRCSFSNRRFLVAAVFGMISLGMGADGPPDTPVWLRFEPEPSLSETLPGNSVPAELYLREPDMELVSTRASEAQAPRSSNPTRTLEQVNTAELTARLDADRLLLSEMRKPVPEDRAEAELYLARLKELSGLADPVRLVPLANRVLDQAPIYFDWLDRDFQSQDEQLFEYYVGGARGFSFALGNFRTAVMFSIMNRLDLASRVITELESNQ